MANVMSDQPAPDDNETGSDVATTDGGTPRRTRRTTLFPAGALEEAMGLAEAIIQAAPAGSIRRMTLLDQLGKSPSSGPTRQWITNSTKYGLTTGSYNAETLALTVLGRKAVDENESLAARARARFQAGIEGVEVFKRRAPAARSTARHRWTQAGRAGSSSFSSRSPERQELVNVPTTSKIDLKKSLDAYRAMPGEFRLVDVPELHYLMIDGRGDPNTSAQYVGALAALYPVAYKVKFISKRSGRDYVVPPLEGLWWADDMTAFTTDRDKSRWDWTMMILVPDWLDSQHIDEAIATVAAKNPPARLGDLRLEALAEGVCVQTLHLGSYDDEAATLASMHDDFIPAHGLAMRGKHHEVYFSDARRTPPAKLRTLLRQPVRAVA